MTFNPYANYEVDEDLEIEGVWHVEEFHRMRLARAGGRNTKYDKTYETLTKPHKRAIALGTLPKETDKALMRELYAISVIKDWSVAELDTSGKRPKVVKDAKGETVWKDGLIYHPVTFEVLPVTKELLMLTFELKPELFNYIAQQANDVKVFQGDDAEDIDEKN